MNRKRNDVNCLAFTGTSVYSCTSKNSKSFTMISLAQKYTIFVTFSKLQVPGNIKMVDYRRTISRFCAAKLIPCRVATHYSNGLGSRYMVGKPISHLDIIRSAFPCLPISGENYSYLK